MNKQKRRLDCGITRKSITRIMFAPRTIPDLERSMVNSSAPTDVSVRTAIKNMLRDGVIEIVQRRYSCYDAIEYKLVNPSLAAKRTTGEIRVFVCGTCNSQLASLYAPCPVCDKAVWK